MLKNVKNINVDLGRRTSKNENYIFHLILEEIELQKEHLEKVCLEGIIIEKKSINLEEKEIYETLVKLIKREIVFQYTQNDIFKKIVFSYISSFEIGEQEIKIFVPIHLINCYKKDKIEHQTSIKSFFYFRQKAMGNFFNFILNNTGNDNFQVSLEKLKNILDVNTDTYNRFFDLEKFVLKPLIEKINEYSLFSINYKKIKNGENKNNKVIALHFHFENNEEIKNKAETNYLYNIIKVEFQNYSEIWEAINFSIQKYGFEATKRNILFIKENNFRISDSEFIEYLNGNGKDIENILQIDDNILIKEKYGIYKNTSTYTKNLYDTIIGYDYYYSLNFTFLNAIKNYKENEYFFYKDASYIIYGYYSKTKGFFKIFEAKK